MNVTLPRKVRGPLLLAVLIAASGCAATAPTPETDGPVARAPEPVPELPDVPPQRGPLAIDLAYPRAGATAPNADSTFLFGSVGDGRAMLTINGMRVPVAANGAFLAYLPVPADGRYRMETWTADARDTFTFAYGRPRPGARVDAFERPRTAVVTGGRDTLSTGSVIAAAGPAPGADRRWFFPVGTRLAVTGALGDLYRVRLTADTDAWVDKAVVELREDTSARTPPLTLDVRPEAHHVDLRLAAAHAPFLVETEPDRVRLTLYGPAAPAATSEAPPDAWVEALAWTAGTTDRAVLDVALARPLWGFKAFYEADGTLVVRLRRPPTVAAEAPLRGLRVMIDAGHPPGGAIGPTGLTEAEANLAITRRLASMLRARGAHVLVTRDTPAPLVSATSVADELWARVDLAVARDAELLVSVHNNAFPDGVDPFERVGTETYYFHGFARPLAEALVDELVATTGLPELGAKHRSLALTRPAWMPAVLTESLFMMFPQQEAALRDEAFLDRLALAHLRGIERFVRGHLGE